MLKLAKVAITGGIASGKTSVCHIFRDLGAFVVNADTIVHELLIPNTDLGKKIIQQFGPEILRNGEFDRKIIAEKVFKDPNLLQSLERLIHPAVFCKIQELYADVCKRGKYTSFVVEVPLLFEVQGESFYDYIVTVIADEAIAKKRFQEKGFQNADYDQRMKRQLSPHQKQSKSHYTLQNNGSLADLRKQVVALNQTLQQL